MGGGLIFPKGQGGESDVPAIFCHFFESYAFWGALLLCRKRIIFEQKNARVVCQGPSLYWRGEAPRIPPPSPHPAPGEAKESVAQFHAERKDLPAAPSKAEGISPVAEPSSTYVGL